VATSGEGGVSADGTSSSAAAPCAIPERFRVLDLERLPVKKKLIALTFDAGANGDAVASIRKTLNDEEVPATFFLTGRFVEDFPAKSKRIATEHLLGNHSMTHPDLTELSDAAVRAEIRTAQQAILDATGEDPRRFFRFPLGARDERTIRIVNNRCYVAFRWTVDTLGWKGTSGGMTAGKVVNRVLAAAKPGAIVLMHVGSHPDDGSMLDADALPRVIDRLRARDYSFVRLSRVMSPAP
jgi:peptidoglycan/xylan/chitin deacetylase (PgdA/CDA1 family)